MATQALDRHQLDLTASRKTLILVWQNPVSRLFVKVGQLDALPEGRFAFQYLVGAWEDPAFVPLLEYPDRETAYISDEVPAFFANRILSAERPNYEQYLGWLGIKGLSVDDVPFEVLARTGGSRATDTFHVVEVPVAGSDRFTSRFFVSGVRHFAGSDEVIADLRDGSILRLELEQANEVNPRAVLVNTSDGQRFGYVPDWLCSDVYARITEGWSFKAVAERVNPEAPAHTRVLCRLEARRG